VERNILSDVSFFTGLISAYYKASQKKTAFTILPNSPSQSFQRAEIKPTRTT